MSEIHQRTSQPPGVLPRNAQYIVMGGIGALVLGMSFFSGTSRTRPVDPKAATPASPRPGQLRDFELMLQQQREREKRQAALNQLQEQRQPHVEHYAGGTARPDRDPAEELERQRRARAPFAPSVVYTAKEPEAATPRDVGPQVVLRAEAEPARPNQLPPNDSTRDQGSGEFLPDREGPNYRLFQGTVVRTALTNRLDGTFTGPVTCTVTHPVLSKDNKVLIPKDTEFIGEARRVEERNQRRLAVWFTRMRRPDNYIVSLERTPGLNSVGETGLKDKTNNHYLRRFSLAGAIGLLGGLRLYGGRPEPYGFESGVMASLGSVASSDLARRTNDVPTITIREGHVVNVYLSEDLLIPEYRGEKGSL